MGYQDRVSTGLDQMSSWPPGTPSQCLTMYLYSSLSQGTTVTERAFCTLVQGTPQPSDGQ